jgi:hypothetical protein
VLASLADGDTDDLARPLSDDELYFLSVAFLLPTVVAPLFFCGRSTGLSATSMTMTLNGMASVHNRFLPGR